jgi:glutamine synthetase
MRWPISLRVSAHPRGREQVLREKLIFVATCEIAGRVRGKGFPASELPSRLVSGVGWVPTNTMITALGPIGDTPFGATGDLILVPDPATELDVDFEDGSAAEHFFLGDIRHTNGTAWECCPRDFLRRALASLKDAAGLDLFASFEHEFVYTGVEEAIGSPYSLDAWRRQGAFCETLVAAMRKANVAPDSFLPEYAKRQYEVTSAPAIGMKAADDAVKVRELARAAADRLGHRAIFSPILDPNGTGNGVHIHFSFKDEPGRPAMHDPAGAFGLTSVAQSFMAGVLQHLPAIAAVTAPSPVSYIRLRPNRWAPTWIYLAERDREACLRICPVLDLPGLDAAPQFNVEFRPADAAASPYLALGAFIHAGVDGIRKRLPLAAPTNVAGMNESERKAHALRLLPPSLGEALDNLEATPEAKDWFGATYLDAYLRHKRAEIKMVEALPESERCALYAETY